MKKAAGIIIIAIGTILLSLNYMSNATSNPSSKHFSFFSTSTIPESKTKVDDVEGIEINLPSIFSVIIGLLK